MKNRISTNQFFLVIFSPLTSIFNFLLINIFCYIVSKHCSYCSQQEEECASHHLNCFIKQNDQLKLCKRFKAHSFPDYFHNNDLGCFVINSQSHPTIFLALLFHKATASYQCKVCQAASKHAISLNGRYCLDLGIVHTNMEPYQFYKVR